MQDSSRYFNVNQTLPYPYNYDYHNNSHWVPVNRGYTSNITFGQKTFSPTTPQNKGSLTGTDVAKGIGILTGIAIACDFLFCKGKHFKQIANGVDDLFKTKKGASVKSSKSATSNTAITTTTVTKPNVVESAKSSVTQPVKNTGVETSAPNASEIINTSVSKTVVTKPQITETVNPSLAQSDITQKVETATNIATDSVKTTINEIKNVEKLNPNISYQEAHRAKIFADERNTIIRQREYIKANGGTLPTNAHTEKLEAEIREIDDMFKKATPLDKEYVVYRGLDIPAAAFRPHDISYVNLINNCKVGDIIKPDAGYTFVALEKANVMGNYAARGLFTIRVPKGTKLIYHDGWEALMPRNAEFKVMEKTIDNNGKINFVLEYIV